MNRRSAAACLVAMIVAACGGGGSGASDTAGAAGATPDPGGAPAAFAATPDIALWGDSMIPGVALAFTYLWDTPRRIFNGGVAGETSTQVAAREMADTDHRDWVTIFWMGHNNRSQPEQVKADIAASVAHLAPGNNRFIVLSVVNDASGAEDRGSPAYDTILKLDSDLAAMYPDNFLDMRSFMVTQFDPQDEQQVQEAQRDVPPASLRAPADPIHLSGNGDEVVGHRIIDFIRAKGW